MTMLNRTLLVILAVMSVLACTREEFAPADVEPIYSENISVVLPEGHAFVSGDEVAAFKLDGTKYMYKTHDCTIFGLEEDVDIPSRIAYVVFPQSEKDSLCKGRFIKNLPSVQNASVGSWDRYAAFCAGRLLNNEAVLQHTVSFLNFTVVQDEVASVQLKSLDGKIAGEYSFLMKELVTSEKTAKSTDVITLQGDFQRGKSYGFAVIPGTLSSFDVVMRNLSGSVIWSKNIVVEKAALSAGQSMDLGEFGNAQAATLAINVSSEEFAGYTVKSLSGYKESDWSKVIGGEFNALLSKEKTTLKVYGLDPVDYSSETIWALIELEKDGHEVTVPMKLETLKLEPSKVTDIELRPLSEFANDAPWYYPFSDSRHECGAGYAYGDANTYLIQYKTSTYSGAVLSPDAAIPSEVLIDFRGRGDFTKIRPFDLSDLTFSFLTYGEDGRIYTQSVDPRYTSITNSASYDIDLSRKAEYKIVVRNIGAHAGAPILLMKSGESVLWAWTFWNIAADGTRLETVKVGDVEIANLDLGQASNQYSKFISAKGTDVNRSHPVRRTAFYYQWGRPLPSFWQDALGVWISPSDPDNHASAPNAYIVDEGAVSIEDMLSLPGAFITAPYKKGTKNDATAFKDWYDGGISSMTDLWGGSEELTGNGIKSIYDPCPKGWRVADYNTFHSVFGDFNVVVGVTAFKTISKDTLEESDMAMGYEGFNMGTFIAKSHSEEATGEGHHILANGCLNPGISATAGLGNAAALAPSWSTTNKKWSNSVNNNSGDIWTNQLKSGSGYTFGLNVSNGKVGMQTKAVSYGCNVRCQKDIDNR